MPYLLVLVLGIFQISHAKVSCGSTTADPATWVDMRAPGKSMHGIPVLDQDGMPYCYAYSGTTLASAWLNKNARKDLTPEQRKELVLSPFVTTVAMEREATNACNHPCNHVDFVFSNGACSANKTLFVGDNGLRPLDSPDVVMEKCVRWETLGSTNKMASKVNQILVDTANKNLEEEAKLREATDFFEKFFAMSSAQKLSSEEITNRARIAFQNLTDGFGLLSQIVAPLCYSREADRLKFTGNFDLKSVLPEGIAPPTCKALTTWNYQCQRPPKDVKVELSSYDYIQSINQAMDKDNPLPVGIDYCWTFLLSGPDTPAARTSGHCRLKGNNKGQSDHKSVLIGRRMNPSNKKCEYLLRNSWGNDCNSYHDGKDSFNESCESELKNNGTADIWVDAELLGDNLHGTETLE